MTQNMSSPRHLWWERGMLVFTAALLVGALLRWSGVTGDGNAYRPLQFVFLTGALTLQPLAAIVGRHSRAASMFCLALSMALLVGAWRATS